jgi:hypothetical protein
MFVAAIAPGSLLRVSSREPVDFGRPIAWAIAPIECKNQSVLFCHPTNAGSGKQTEHAFKCRGSLAFARKGVVKLATLTPIEVVITDQERLEEAECRNELLP